MQLWHQLGRARNSFCPPLLNEEIRYNMSMIPHFFFYFNIITVFGSFKFSFLFFGCFPFQVGKHKVVGLRCSDGMEKGRGISVKFLVVFSFVVICSLLSFV